MIKLVVDTLQKKEISYCSSYKYGTISCLIVDSNEDDEEEYYVSLFLCNAEDWRRKIGNIEYGRKIKQNETN